MFSNRLQFYIISVTVVKAEEKTTEANTPETKDKSEKCKVVNTEESKVKNSEESKVENSEESKVCSYMPKFRPNVLCGINTGLISRQQPVSLTIRQIHGTQNY